MRREDVPNAVQRIRSSLEKSGPRRAIGLCVKTNVGRIPGSPQRRYAVLALSTEDTAVVFHLLHFSDRRSDRAGVATVNLPPDLVELLHDDTIYKVAIRIKPKVTTISQQYNLLLGQNSIRGVLCLNQLAVEKMPSENKVWHLDTLVPRVLRRRWEPSWEVELGTNWESAKLREDQLSHAGDEAAANVMLYASLQDGNFPARNEFGDNRPPPATPHSVEAMVDRATGTPPYICPQ